MIPFDYPELIKRIGGDDATTPRLDKFFSKLICWGEPCFNMANEPDFVTPYAYVFAGQPWKTQQVITRIEQQTFNTKSDGIPGNDDLGATSGVYVWNALGLYPGIPGVGGLLLGTPMFPSATVHFGDGRTLSHPRHRNRPLRPASPDQRQSKHHVLAAVVRPGPRRLETGIQTKPRTQQTTRPANKRTPTKLHAVSSSLSCDVILSEAPKGAQSKDPREHVRAKPCKARPAFPKQQHEKGCPILSRSLRKGGKARQSTHRKPSTRSDIAHK